MANATCVTVVILAAGVVTLLLLAASVVGMFLPKDYVFRTTAVLPRDVQTVYRAVRDFERVPLWRPEIARVDILGPTQYREQWRLSDGITPMDFEITTEQPEKKLVTRRATGDANWTTYEFEPVPEGTRVTITREPVEEGWIFRTIGRLEKDRMARRYLKYLRKYLA